MIFLVGLPVALLLAALVFVLFSRRHRPLYNRPLVGVEEPGRAELPPPRPALVWLALSGGGTRAAALAFSVLEELAAIPFPGKEGGRSIVSNLADEIDYISGISGGSFTAAAWCRFKDDSKGWERFRSGFLERNIERALLRNLLLPPWRAARLISREYDRINVAAELYDREVFAGSTFSDLPARPQLHLHATHLALGARLSFTRESFNLIGSDLDSYPLGYACAASSAFPGLLSPMTVLNHGKQLSPEELKLDAGYRKLLRESREFAEQDFRRIAREYYNDKSNRFVHLADGGLVDNQGLQSILDEFETNGDIQRRMGDPDHPLSRLIIINVNAGTRPDEQSGRSLSSPSVVSVLASTMVTSMDILSARRWAMIQDQCRLLYSPVIDETPHIAFGSMEEPYTVEINFRNLTNPDERRRCMELKTTFKLDRDDLDLIRKAAQKLVAEDPELLRLRKSVELELAARRGQRVEGDSLSVE